MITSAHNPRIQLVRKLQTQAKQRREQGAFVVEGVRLVEEALQSGWEAVQVFYTGQLEARGMRVVEAYSARGVAVEQVAEAVMKSVSETETSQGLLAVLRAQRLPLPRNPHFLLVLDGVRDPGNLGTILRTALAVSVQGVLLAPGSVDLTSPKVMRAGMGAHFRLPAHTMGWDEIECTIKGEVGGLRAYLADARAGVPYTQADFRSPLALIIGGEAAGAGAEAASLVDERVHIPMPGGAESLNAAVAAGILLFEVLRQRGK
jgi:RNA methyltransferase, TrmH family